MNKKQKLSEAVNASMYPYPYQNLSLVDMVGEVWKPLPGLDEFVMVSNLGRIKKLARWCYHSDRSKKTLLKEAIIK